MWEAERWCHGKGDSLLIFATYVSCAQNDGHSPLVAMVWRTVISVAGMVAAPLRLSGRVVVLALAAAISVGDLVGAGQLGRRVHRRLRRLMGGSFRRWRARSGSRC